MKINKETFSCEGMWRLPGDPDDELPGTLYYHFQAGLKLELKGIFKPFINENPRTSTSTLILGESSGKKITLYGCVGVKTFYCQIAFIDHHFSSTEEMKFKKVFVNFSHIDEWLGISGFKVTTEYDNEKETPKILIEYIQPKPIVVKLNEIFSIIIDFSYELPTGFYNQSEATIKQTITVCIESIEDRKISHFFNVISQLERFFSLGIMKQVDALNFKGIKTNSDERETYSFPINIYMILNENLDVRKKIDREKMLFTYNDINDKFELLLQNWFNKRELLQPVFDLYFTAVHNRDIPDYLEFLSYVQAIESFHRRTRNNKIRPTSEFRILRNEILAKLDEKQKKMVGQRLDHANEPSLNDRLNEIFKEYFEFIFFFSIEKDQFIRDIVNTRNFHTHYDEDLKKKALTGANLHDATKKLRAILQLIFLLELGFDRDGINKFAGKLHRWQLDVVYNTFKI